MYIDEIHVLINEFNSAKLFCNSHRKIKPDRDSSWFQTAARILVDMAYEAGRDSVFITSGEARAMGYEEGFRHGYEAARNHCILYMYDESGKLIPIIEEKD